MVIQNYLQVRDGPLAAITSEASPAIESRSVSIYTPENLYRPWMSIALVLGSDIEEMEHNSEEYSRPIRSTVNIDYATSVPPLTMTWTQFVFLMLGLQVEPQFFLELNDGDRLKVAERVHVRVSRIDNKWLIRVNAEKTSQRCEISLRTAFTALKVMMMVSDPQANVTSFVPENRRHRDSGRLGTMDNFFHIEEVRAGIDEWKSDFEHRYERFHLEETLTWALYYYRLSDSINAGSGRFRGHCGHYIRLRSLWFLWKIPRQQIHDMLQQICNDEKLMKRVEYILKHLRDDWCLELRNHDMLEVDLKCLRRKLEEILHLPMFDEVHIID